MSLLSQIWLISSPACRKMGKWKISCHNAANFNPLHQVDTAGFPLSLFKSCHTVLSFVSCISSLYLYCLDLLNWQPWYCFFGLCFTQLSHTETGCPLAVSKAGLLQPVLLLIAESACGEHPADGSDFVLFLPCSFINAKDPPLVSPQDASSRKQNVSNGLCVWPLLKVQDSVWGWNSGKYVMKVERARSRGVEQKFIFSIWPNVGQWKPCHPHEYLCRSVNMGSARLIGRPYTEPLP